MSGSVGADTIESAAHRQRAHCSSEATPRTDKTCFRPPTRACAGSSSLDRAHPARSYVPTKAPDHERAGCARSNEDDRARLRLGPTGRVQPVSGGGNLTRLHGSQGRDGFSARERKEPRLAPMSGAPPEIQEVTTFERREESSEADYRPRSSLPSRAGRRIQPNDQARTAWSGCGPSRRSGRRGRTPVGSRQLPILCHQAFEGCGQPRLSMQLAISLSALRLSP